MKYLTRQSPGVVIIDECPLDVTYRYQGRRGTAGGGEVGKLDVGQECNLLLSLAANLEKNTVGFHVRMQATQNEYADAIRSVVARVAEFEELETED
jgi:hypothetical protein